MINIKKVIKDYLSTWKECKTCNHMCKEALLIELNNDGFICVDCVSDEPTYGQAQLVHSRYNFNVVFTQKGGLI